MSLNDGPNVFQSEIKVGVDSVCEWETSDLVIPIGSYLYYDLRCTLASEGGYNGYASDIGDVDVYSTDTTEEMTPDEFFAAAVAEFNATKDWLDSPGSSPVEFSWLYSRESDTRYQLRCRLLTPNGYVDPDDLDSGPYMGTAYDVEYIEGAGVLRTAEEKASSLAGIRDRISDRIDAAKKPVPE